MGAEPYYLIALLAFAPGIFWLGYIYKKDKWEPEPQKLVLCVFFLGMLAVIPAMLASFVLSLGIPHREISSAYRTCFIAPVIEELCKFLVVYLTIFRSWEFDEPMDGIVYAAAAALGFASLENVSYLWFEYQTPEFVPPPDSSVIPQSALWNLAFLRGILSVPGHVIDSCMWGYALGVAKFLRHRALARIIIVKGLILGMALHALFNSLASYGLSVAGLLILQVSLLYYLNKKVKIALHKSPYANPIKKPIFK
ncbi:MAG: PrsW family intramembrane metalloprotease [Candidatus Omnitrophota bacterium]